MVHTEDIQITFQEEEIVKLLEKCLHDKYYLIKYNDFKLTSAVFNFSEEGKAQLEFRYKKIVKEIDIFDGV